MYHITKDGIFILSVAIISLIVGVLFDRNLKEIMKRVFFVTTGSYLLYKSFI